MVKLEFEQAIKRALSVFKEDLGQGNLSGVVTFKE